jgi:membrane fusion protein (multidrug efflux system)
VPRSEQSPPPKEHETSSPERLDKPKSLRDRLREHRVLGGAAACLLFAAVIGGLFYWLSVRDYESTDDAFVAARSFSIAPKVGG